MKFGALRELATGPIGFATNRLLLAPELAKGEI
jgi:hypothetical protein